MVQEMVEEGYNLVCLPHDEFSVLSDTTGECVDGNSWYPDALGVAGLYDRALDDCYDYKTFENTAGGGGRSDGSGIDRGYWF